MSRITEDVSMLLRWTASIFTILGLYTGFIWMMLGSQLAPVRASLENFDQKIVSVQDKQDKQEVKLTMLEVTLKNLVDKR